MKTKIIIHGDGSCFYYAFCLAVLVVVEDTDHFATVCEKFFDATPEEIKALKEELPGILHEFPNPFTGDSALKKLIEERFRKKVRVYIRDHKTMYLDGSVPPALAFPSVEALNKHLVEQRRSKAYATDVEVHAVAHLIGVTIQVNNGDLFNEFEDEEAWLGLDTINLEHVMIGAVGHYNCYLPTADYNRLYREWVTDLFTQSDLRKVVPLLSRTGVIELRGVHGETALHWACFYGYFDVVVTLCKLGIDLHLADTTKRRTGLHWSVKNFSSDRKNQEKIILLMLREGVDPKLLDYKERSAHQLATASADKKLKKLFTPATASKNKAGKTSALLPVNEWRKNLSLHLTINGAAFTVPGNKLHAELKGMENLFRLTLTHVEHHEGAYVVPEKSAAAGAGAGSSGFVTPIISPEKAGAGASYIATGDTNFVVANLGFVVVFEDDSTDFISFPIRFPNKPLFTVYDSQNYSFTFFTKGARGKQAHYPLFEAELKDKVGVLDGGIFESNYVHSEQALLSYLEKPETIGRLVLAFKYALRGRHLVEIYQSVLDLHTSRYMCKRCEKCVRAFLNPKKPEFSFQKYLSSALQKEFSDVDIPAILPLIARVTADAEFDGPQKMPDEHDTELVSDAVLETTNLFMKDTREDVSVESIYKFPFLAHGLHQHSVATSGGSDEVGVRRQHVAYKACVTQAYASAARKIQTVFRGYRDKKLQVHPPLFDRGMELYTQCEAVREENRSTETPRNLEDIPEYEELIAIIEKLTGDSRNELARLVYEMQSAWDESSCASDEEDDDEENEFGKFAYGYRG